MLDGEAVVAQVQQGTWPQDWLVLRAKSSHYIRLAIFIAIFLVLVAVGLVYLFGHPAEAFALGGANSPDSGPVDANTFSIWRTVDFVALGLSLVGLTLSFAKTLLQAAHAKEQVLIVLAEGFVLKTRRLQAFAFGDMRTLSATSYRGVVTLSVVAVDGRKSSVRLDARFGGARKVAQRILAARNQLASALGAQASGA